MSQSILKVDEKNLKKHEAALESAKKILGENNACCILIACTKPAEDGNMQVEMHYEGDEILAAFLLENASQIFDDRRSQRESK